MYAGTTKKYRIYLDTSVVSYLFSDSAHEKMEDSIQLWQECVADKFEIFISTLVLDEIERCPEPKRSHMLEKMGQIIFNTLKKTDEVDDLATEYIKGGVLSEKSRDDCLHIAYAVVHNCDLIVSWNFRHLVNVRTIDKVKVVNAINRYRGIEIVSPAMLIDMEGK
jgi:predicted nucleic acid-binding protein